MRTLSASGTGFALASVGAVLVKLWLVGPHELVAVNMPHDDLLFVTLAEHIIRGEWLGPYNQLTLIKGPFYPLFIAAGYYLNIPLPTAQHLFYAVACAVFTGALAPIVHRRWLLFVIFIFLLFNPFSFNYPAMGRVLRLGIYQSLGLLVFGGALGLALRLDASRSKAAGWAVLTGLALAALWHTREESIWVVPPLFIVAAAVLYRARAAGASDLLIRGAVLLVPGVILAFSTVLLRELNDHHYGIDAVIEIKTPEFKSAYGGLLRVRSDDWRRYYPAVEDVRRQVYRVSPTFASLMPYLEGEVGSRWIALAGSDDIPAGFFIWALRDAAAYAGHHASGPAAMAFYRQVGREIEAACEAGELRCRPRVFSLMPPWHREFNRLILPTLGSVFARIATFADFSADTTDVMSKGPAAMMRRYEASTRARLRTSREDVRAGYPPYHLRLEREKIRILQDIGSFYQVAVPIMFAVSLLGLLAVLVRPGAAGGQPLLTMFALAALAGIGSITVILSLVVITSYDSIHRAMHVGYPLVLVVIATMTVVAAARFDAARQEDWR